MKKKRILIYKFLLFYLITDVLKIQLDITLKNNGVGYSLRRTHNNLSHKKV